VARCRTAVANITERGYAELAYLQERCHHRSGYFGESVSGRVNFRRSVITDLGILGESFSGRVNLRRGVITDLGILEKVFPVVVSTGEVL
jgi:hypothetical protein